MSVKQMALVWEYEFDHAEQSIMLALADHAHDDGTEIRPSVARLAWKTGYEERQVHRILKRLRDERKVLKLVKQGGGRGKPNIYRFDWTKAVKKSPFTPKQKRVTSEKKKGDISEKNPDTAMSDEPSSLEPSVKNHSRRDGKPSQDEEKATNYFDVFTEAAKILGYEVTGQDRKELPGNLKALRDSGKHDDEFMRKVVRRCLAARADRQYPLSPQTARDELLGNVRTLERKRDSIAVIGATDDDYAPESYGW